MAYTTIKKPSDYFNTLLYTGTGAENAQTGVGFQPDLTWLKRRNGVGSHRLFDAVRGATKAIYPDATLAESTDAQSLKSFDSDGFTLGTDGATNGSGNTYANWNWLANGAGSANTDGSISSTVSANTTSGFSIVSWTGTGANATIGHGLGAECKMVIIKNRTDVVDWSVNHQPLCASLGDYTRYLTLNSNGAVSGAGNVAYQNTPFTSSVFNVGTSNTTNGSGDNIIAYCFADVQGYSKFGSYVGNGNADGTFIYTGFSPAFIITKPTSTTGQWTMFDNKRDPANVGNKKYLHPNTSGDEGDANSFDFLSNGFKLRLGGGDINTSGTSYIYMAFAEQPLVGDNPATAR